MAHRMTTISRTALREALNSVGITTEDMTELIVTPHTVTITRFARDYKGDHITGLQNDLMRINEVIPIGA